MTEGYWGIGLGPVSCLPSEFNTTYNGFLPDRDSFAAHNFCLDATAGEWASIRMFAQNDTTLDTYLNLYDPEGNLVASNDDGYEIDYNSFLSYQFPVSGQYRLEATRFPGTQTFGDFRLRIERGRQAAVTDVNFDCVVNNNDVVAVTEAVFGSSSAVDVDTADINLDGLNMLDTQLVLNHAFDEDAPSCREAPPRNPTVAVSEISDVDGCSQDIWFDLNDFAPNSAIQISNVFTETSCSTGETYSSEWGATHNQPTDSNGNLRYGARHGGRGSYTFTFTDEEGNARAVSFDTTENFEQGEFSAEVTVSLSATEVQVGDTLVATVDIQDNSVNCQFAAYDLTLSQDGDKLFEFNSPATVGPGVGSSTAFTMTAVQAGTVQLNASVYGEQNCGGFWSWTYVNGSSEMIRVVAAPETPTPEPVTPEPITPEPVTPEPVTPEPITPEPVTPEPITPELVTPEPVTPEPAIPTPPTPEPPTETIISPENGGTISGTMGITVEVDFPAGMHSEPFTVSMAPVAEPPSTGVMRLLGRIFSIVARDGADRPVTQFAQPYTLTVRYADADVVGMNEADLVLHYWDVDAERWEEVPTVVDAEANTLTASLDHLTEFAVLETVSEAVQMRVYLPSVVND